MLDCGEYTGPAAPEGGGRRGGYSVIGPRGPSFVGLYLLSEAYLLAK